MCNCSALASFPDSNLILWQDRVNFTYLWSLLILQDVCSTPQIPCHTAKHAHVVTGTSSGGERKWWAALQVPDDWAVKEDSRAAN